MNFLTGGSLLGVVAAVLLLFCPVDASVDEASRAFAGTGTLIDRKLQEPGGCLSSHLAPFLESLSTFLKSNKAAAQVARVRDLLTLEQRRLLYSFVYETDILVLLSKKVSKDNILILMMNGMRALKFPIRRFARSSKVVKGLLEIDGDTYDRSQVELNDAKEATDIVKIVIEEMMCPNPEMKTTLDEERRESYEAIILAFVHDALEMVAGINSANADDKAAIEAIAEVHKSLIKCASKHRRSWLHDPIKFFGVLGITLGIVIISAALYILFGGK
jgi:hypothetical protein